MIESFPYNNVLLKQESYEVLDELNKSYVSIQQCSSYNYITFVIKVKK